jgi:aminoglycoside phosphotransferase (APT) family kinase protein
LGIALTAFCNSDLETFAAVIVPKDDLDRQYRLMGKLLKLSCPLPSARAIVVRNSRRWEILQMRHGERSKLIEL